MKKTMGAFFALILGILFLQIPSAEAFSVLEMGDQHSVAGNYREADFTAENGEKVRFSYDPFSRKLYLMSKDRTKTYLIFEPTWDLGNQITFDIRSLYTVDPAMHLWEIIAKSGTDVLRNCGYWIVGQHNGEYVNFVTIESLKAVGYRADEHHRLTSKRYTNGNMVIIGETQRTKKSGLWGPKKAMEVDFRASLFWDAAQDWFGLRRLNQ